MHDAHAALLRDRDRQARLGHRVHRGGHQRQVQGDVAGEAGREGGVLGKDLGERRHQQHIVEGERFSKRRMSEAPKDGLYPWPPYLPCAADMSGFVTWRQRITHMKLACLDMAALNWRDETAPPHPAWPCMHLARRGLRPVAMGRQRRPQGLQRHSPRRPTSRPRTSCASRACKGDAARVVAEAQAEPAKAQASAPKISRQGQGAGRKEEAGRSRRSREEESRGRKGREGACRQLRPRQACEGRHATRASASRA